jgi:hypothetical protein
MDKEFIQYVYARCEKAIENNAKYGGIQNKCIDAIGRKDFMECSNLTAESETLVQEISYIRGYQDGLRQAMLALKSI